MNLVIVESPTKAKTIEKYLGKNFKVLASGGHVRDLPQKSLGIDLKNNFEPKYVVSQNKKEVLKNLKEAVKKADSIYLATDPDREGEAISWHLASVLGIPVDENNRIEFHEITQKAVKNSLENSRKINLDLVNAQQARRVLDRLVGYKLSPLLCKKIANNLSAGRVQSVALRFLVDREREIENFVKEEYYVITGFFKSAEEDKKAFKAVLSKKNNKVFKPTTSEESNEILSNLKGAKYQCSKVKKAVSKTRPYAPFTTSTLQQEASIKLNMSSDITMRIAQQLYEGINMKSEGHVALVTYIRTDSTRVSSEAITAVREKINAEFGKDYLPTSPNFFSNKKDSQDAHESIRPISLDLTPEKLDGKLDRNQLRLYKLIYERFVMSQMSDAIYDTVNGEITGNDYTFKFSGKNLKFDGFLALSAKRQDKSAKDDDEDGENAYLPVLTEGQSVFLDSLGSEQKFTKPPARFSDATLIKLLEEKGIGRPSTYATILNTLLKRQYTYKEKRNIIPTDIAKEVIDFLIENFSEVVNSDYTAKIESELDDIERNGIAWQEIVGEFFTPLEEKIKKVAYERIEIGENCPKCGSALLQKISKFGKFIACENSECKYTRPMEEDISDVICEKCGSNMVYRNGRFGRFLACPNYPECSNIKSLKVSKETDQVCEKCGSKMLMKSGKFGDYLACSNYPDCKNTKSLAKKVATCPKCGKDVVPKRSKTGKEFYGCTGYPDCDFLSWDIPSDKKCEKCGSYMVIKNTKAGKFLRCSNNSCKNEENLDSDTE